MSSHRKYAHRVLQSSECLPNNSGYSYLKSKCMWAPSILFIKKGWTYNKTCVFCDDGSVRGAPHHFLICCHCFSLSSFFRVLERIGARALVAHVRTFADFLVYEFSTSAGGQQLNKCIEILNDMVWKYNIVTLDRLILCLVRISNPFILWWWPCEHRSKCFNLLFRSLPRSTLLHSDITLNWFDWSVWFNSSLSCLWVLTTLLTLLF